MRRRSGSVGGLGGQPPRSTRPGFPPSAPGTGAVVEARTDPSGAVIFTVALRPGSDSTRTLIVCPGSTAMVKLSVSPAGAMIPCWTGS